IRPREFSSHILYIKSDHIPVRLAIEWICRQLGCRYRIDGKKSVWLSGSYDWLNQEEDRAVLIESIAPAIGNTEDIKPTARVIDELVKVTSLYQEYSVRIEEEDMNIVAILPNQLKNVLKDALLAMEEPGISLDKPASTTLSDSETELYQILQKKVVAKYNNWSVKDVIGDLQLQTGASIAFDPSAFRKKEMPKITMDAGTKASLRLAITELARQMGLEGYEISVPGGIYLTQQKREWTVASSREFLWDSIAVKAFDIKKLARQSSGEAIAHHIRRQVSPDTWQDPCTAVVFHEPSNNLLVVAPERVINKVHVELDRIAKQSPAEKEK
ncbi:MAG: hypothetical protein JXR97_04085, partial [Planctomycetes bacterium]|nr:hypothetical protein [Planctomycetota bacterium]